MTIIVDSPYLGHQALHSVGPLTHRGKPTGVIFGFLVRILSIGMEFQTNDFIFCWDSKSSFRKQAYPDYKKRKPKTEEERRLLQEAFEQFDLLREQILPAIGFNRQLLQEGCEADDLIGRLCLADLDPRIRRIVVSADEDLFQILDACDGIWNPSSKEMMTETAFHKRFGDRLQPKDWAWVKAIGGCSSDAIPGIRGVGEKTAVQYILCELKESSAYMARIEKGLAEAKRFVALTRIPIPQTRPLRLPEQTSLSIADLMDVAQQYGLTSFEGNLLESWDALLNGDWNRRDLLRLV